MTTLKLDSKVSAAAQAALEPYVNLLYARQGMRIVGVIELAHVERVQPAPDSDGKASVKVKVTHCEVAGREQEGAIREAMKALFVQRTAAGTIDETDGQVQLSEDTLRLTGGLLHSIESARLKVALEHWAAYARRVVNTGELSLTEIRYELQAVADGLTAALNDPRTDESGDD